MLCLHHLQVQTYSTYNYKWSYKYIYIQYIYIYIIRTYIRNISNIYLPVAYPYPKKNSWPLSWLLKKTHHLQGKFLQVTAPMVVVMVIKTDKATSPPANKAKRFEADPGIEVRIFDYWINSKSTQNSLITCFVDVFCSVICLLWKPSNGDTMLVFAWYRASRNWISPPNLF